MKHIRHHSNKQLKIKSSLTKCLQKILIIVGIFSISATVFAGTKIETRVNKTTVTADETIILEIKITSDNSIDQAKLIGLNKLQLEFAVLSQNKSVAQKIFNWKSSHELKLTMQILPKDQTNTSWKIPKLAYGNESSKPILITLDKNTTKKKRGQDILFSVDVDKKPVFVGQPINYTLIIKSSVGLRKISLNSVDIKNSFTRELEQKNYEEMIDATNYIVYELPFIVFPTQAGELTIPARTINAQVIATNAMNGVYTTKHIRKETSAINIKILPPPTTYKDKNKTQSLPYWLPANSIEVQDKWINEKNAIQGDVISRVIKLYIQGSLSNQITSDLLTHASNKGFDIYAQKPKIEEDEKNATNLIWEQSIDYLLTKGGLINIPAHKIIWWDNINSKFQTLVIPAKKIQIASNGNASQMDNSNTPKNMPTATSTKKSSKDNENDSKNTKNDDGILIAIWQYMSIYVFLTLLAILAMVALSIYIYLLYKAYKIKLQKKEYKKQELLNILEKSSNNDSYVINLQRKMLSWSRVYWKSKDINLQQFLQTAKGLLDHATGTELEELIQTIETRYQKQGDVVANKPITHISKYKELLITLLELDAKKILKQKSKNTKKTNNDLPCLYPNKNKQ